jgi:aspartate/methionine/tyrosine aminotransferase
MAYDGTWHVDLDSLRRAVTPRTRAVFVVSPNNPTGTYLKRAELAAIVALDLPIVSDEVFARYPLREDPDRVTTVLEAKGASLLFALGGLSKLAALPQMKVAWTAVSGAPARMAHALARLELLADSFLSVGTPIQHALPALLASGHVARDAITARTLHNLARLRAHIGPSSALSVLDVEGGWYAVLRVPRTRTEEAWAVDLVRDHGVYVHPGQFFGFESEAYLVLSLLTPEADFDSGIQKVVRAIA